MGEVEKRSTQTPAERSAEEREKRSRTHQLLLEHARLSPQEIEDKTGIPAAQAASQLAELLASRDYLTERMEERLLMIELNDFVQETLRRQRSASDEDFALMAGVTLRAYREIANRLDARRRLTDQDINAISAAQGNVMMETISLALDIASASVVKLHPELPALREELEAAFRQSLPVAHEHVKKHVRQ